MGVRNQNSTNYVHADEPNLLNIHKALQYDPRGSSKEGKPKCLPKSKAQSLGKKGRAKAAGRKRRQDPNANRSGKAINVKTK